MIGRIVRSADFERVLGSPTQARSPHFAVHYLRSAPSRPARPVAKSAVDELSTGDATVPLSPVDESPSGCWLGTVVPKRHARRSVTRSLLKRQIRVAAGEHLAQLPPGLWVVRLRSPFDVRRFASAASDALRAEAGRELSRLMADAARRAASR